MRRREVDELAVREHALHLLRRVVPLVRTVEVVEGQRAAAQQELAQDRHLVVAQAQVARLDDVDPAVVPQLGIVQREDDGIVDLDGRGGAQPARQVLLGRRGIDGPRLAPVIDAIPAVHGEGGVANAHERPLQAGEAVVLQQRHLRDGL